MGGNAIKKVPVKRIPLERYQQILKRLREVLSAVSIRFGFPYETPGKESFGDIDVLVDTSCGIGQSKEEVFRFLEETFHPPEIVSNGYVVSFAYQYEEDYHQVDFILVSTLDMAQLYFSYGDSGAIIGRYTHFHGLTFSESGLLVKVKTCYLPSKQGTDNDNIIDTITLSSNPAEVCQYLGLDYERWGLGFTSSDDIFEWIVQSKFYKREIYLFLKMEHRKRAQLRPFYQNFLEFIGVDREEIGDISLKTYNPDVLQHVMDAIDYFGKREEFASIESKRLQQEERKLKFNSSIFLLHGINQSQLAETMKTFKLEKGLDTFDTWIDSNNSEQIEAEIVSWILRQEK